LSDARIRIAIAIAIAATTPLAVVVDLWSARPGVSQLRTMLLCG
jgi:hypothetical protein